MKETVEINDYLEEITDRFGPPPDEVLHCLRRLKLDALRKKPDLI